MNPFSLPFMQYAVAASLLSGVALSFIGLFILVRRVSFSGLAVSQMAALGTVIGVVLGVHIGEFGFALAAVGAGMLLLDQFSKQHKVPQEIGVASLYILGAGASVLILSKAPGGESHTLSVFFGNVLSLGKFEIVESVSVLVLTVFILGFWFYRWLWLAFDSQSVEVSGINCKRWNFLFHMLFALAMTVSIHIFGVLLAFSYLLLPAAAGLLLTNRIKTLVFFIPLYTALATLAGYYFSFQFDCPAGPFLSSLLALMVLLAGIWR